MYFRLFIVASFLCTTVFAQSKKLDMDHENFFRFGAKAGLNMNKVNGVSYKKGFNYNYQLGGFIQINFSNRLGIQPELSFVQASSEFTSDGTDIYDDLFGGGSQKKVSLSYIEVPVLLNVNLGMSKRIKFQVGPAYSGLLKQKAANGVTTAPIYKSSDWSAMAGFWFQLPFINGGARYKMGLSNVNAVDDREKWTNQSVQLFIGFTF